jgi:hypothetical protein
MRGRVFVLGGILLLSWWPAVVGAQIYRWVDENGVPHFADGIDSVPGPYRSKAVPLGIRNAPAAPTAPPGAPSAKASGEASVRFVPGQRILVDVRINGNADAKLLLDTGSDKTLISPRALQAAGVRITGPTTTAEVTGATGSGQIQFVVVDSLEVGEAKVGRMSVGSQDIPVAGGDGVLGRDFLDQFNVAIDSGKGIVTLSPK